jgi:hypothetical protein
MLLRNRNLPKRLNCHFPDTPLGNQFLQSRDKYLSSTFLMTYLSKYMFISFYAGIQMGALQHRTKSRIQFLAMSGAKVSEVNSEPMKERGAHEWCPGKQSQPCSLAQPGSVSLIGAAMPPE